MGSSWEMPKPVFRSSKGEPVGGEHAAGDEHDTIEPSPPAQPEAPQAFAAPAPPPPAIADQPYISDAYTEDELGVATAKGRAARSTGSAGTLAKLGLAIVVFAFFGSVAVFLYWFFAMRMPE